MKPLVCIKCGYLTEHSLDRCPECGRVIIGANDKPDGLANLESAQRCFSAVGWASPCQDVCVVGYALVMTGISYFGIGSLRLQELCLTVFIIAFSCVILTKGIAGLRTFSAWQLSVSIWLRHACWAAMLFLSFRTLFLSGGNLDWVSFKVLIIFSSAYVLLGWAIWFSLFRMLPDPQQTERTWMILKPVTYCSVWWALFSHCFGIGAYIWLAGMFAFVVFSVCCYFGYRFQLGKWPVVCKTDLGRGGGLQP